MRGDAEIGMAELILSRPGVLAATLLGTAVIGTLAWLVAARLGWSRVAAALAACGLAVALAVTLARPGVLSPTTAAENPLAACIGGPVDLHGTQARLNVAMLMPFAFFATVASRRPVLVTACCGLLSAGIEAFQAFSDIGVCETNDVVANTVGGAVAALVGWLCAAVFGGLRHGRPRGA